ncbi:uncharacterized protein MYCFIDRAFT_122736, partial [Pseudocercospora fijiensis CIRAD86]
THQYTSEYFVESAGTILFRLSTRQICLVKHHKRNEYLLPKGRRNVGESRQETAVRETREETGFPTKLLPVTFRTHCTPNVEETEFTPDKPRRFENIVEPFMVGHRVIPNAGVKLIWWYIGAIDEEAVCGKGEEQFSAELFSFDEALKALHYQQDRDVVARAIEVFE